MYSQDNRSIYGKNQLGEVICQLRFPEILIIGSEPPVAFQEAIRDEYPVYSARKESPAPRITGTPGNLSLENQPQTVNHQFASADGAWRVNLTSRFIALACNKPAFFERVGLRYLNFFSRKALDLDGIPFRELIEPCYLGPLAAEELTEVNTSRCSVDADFAIRGGCRAKIHAGPGLIKRGTVQDSEPRFILDLDLYMPGKVPVNYSAGALQTIHSQAWPIFRGAITDKLHEAMEPKD